MLVGTLGSICSCAAAGTAHSKQDSEEEPGADRHGGHGVRRALLHAKAQLVAAVAARGNAGQTAGVFGARGVLDGQARRVKGAPLFLGRRGLRPRPGSPRRRATAGAPPRLRRS